MNPTPRPKRSAIKSRVNTAKLDTRRYERLSRRINNLADRVKCLEESMETLISQNKTFLLQLGFPSGKSVNSDQKKLADFDDRA